MDAYFSTNKNRLSVISLVIYFILAIFKTVLIIFNIYFFIINSSFLIFSVNSFKANNAPYLLYEFGCVELL